MSFSWRNLKRPFPTSHRLCTIQKNTNNVKQPQDTDEQTHKQTASTARTRGGIEAVPFEFSQWCMALQNPPTATTPTSHSTFLARRLAFVKKLHQVLNKNHQPGIQQKVIWGRWKNLGSTAVPLSWGTAAFVFGIAWVGPGAGPAWIFASHIRSWLCTLWSTGHCYKGCPGKFPGGSRQKVLWVHMPTLHLGVCVGTTSTVFAVPLAPHCVGNNMFISVGYL